MTQPGLILIGAGGHAHACIDVIEQHGIYQIAGLVGLPSELHAKHLGYEVIGTDSDLPQLVKTCPFALITLGQIQTPEHRLRLYQLTCQFGFEMPAIISPSAFVSRHAALGAGTVVMHGAVVNAGVSIGNNCIINSQALIEHDVTVADHCHISTGAILNGNVDVGSGCFVGSGSVIKEGIHIGARSVVGMSLAVRHDLPEQCRYTGQKDS
ncbi:MAG: acetyltransferase [Rhodoferax sp.]|nr:acetyltransferase [Rhodoferax sp.]